ncbi:AAA family ATPase [Flavobacterium coralii]|uniref:ATP-dependent nuclease n=1 Tax=Flavobacterium coralii TaxID=2838017 RepID=UPI000C5C3045|nr:ATP-dependent endonuclease [Flavobacterium sp.]|tara:strand:- start:33546 stop:35642 length:2097 start_codon:yes stop_codon:yes gene_type:complete
MYISKIFIDGFRNFTDKTIEFNEGVNVIIGHNNAGKTSLLKAIGLIVNNEASRRLEIDDFSKTASLEDMKSSPPEVKITLLLTQSLGEDLSSDDLVTVGNWLTSLQEPYQAQLTYNFYLPFDKHSDYIESLDHSTSKEEAWLTIKHEFLRFYTYKIFGGDPKLQVPADSESLQKFDFQFLNAIRDVERDMFTGRNTMLRDVLDFFMDYDIKSADESVKSLSEKQKQIKEIRKEFTAKAGTLISDLQTRMHAGKGQILSYARQTGATFNNAEPDFDGTISDVDMYSALKLIIGYSGLDLKIPATHNGLGYNNLIFMSLLLAKMQVNSDGNYLGGNAKVFPVLAIEEPEAHLHPAMQYKFLKFLKENKEERKVRQIFVTTHSTQITSAVSLDEIICLHNEKGVISVGYPGRTFPNTPAGTNSKAYVQRFLDATRSDMLFAQKIIMVEGLAEQVLLPTLSRYVGIDLEDHHVAIIPVGGRFFDHFLHMFDTTNPNAIPKKVVCLKDRDPERKSKSGGTYSSCYTFRMDQDPTQYDYKDHAKDKIAQYATHSNIRFFGQNHKNGKTFEYELLLNNIGSTLLLTDSISNRAELESLFKCYANGEELDEYYKELRKSTGNDKLKDALSLAQLTTWTDAEKAAAIIAYRFLSSVGKGQIALELAVALEDNLALPDTNPTTDPNAAVKNSFNVPTYIKDAIQWLCQ